MSDREIRSLLGAIGAVFLTLLVSGLILVLVFKPDRSVGPLVEETVPLNAPLQARPPAVRDGDVGYAGASPATPTASAPRPLSGVRAGIFRVVANAERMEARLRAAGYKPFVVLVSQDGGTLRYVYAGAFPSDVQALALADTLRAQGIDVWIEPVFGDGGPP